MLTNSEISRCAHHLLETPDAGRVFPNYRINEDVSADILCVTPNQMVGVFAAEDTAGRAHKSSEAYKTRIKTLERTLDANYGLVRVGAQGGVRLLANWGVIRSDEQQIDIPRMPRASEVDLWRQVSLLWKGELEALLRACDIQVARGLNKIELVLEVLTMPDLDPARVRALVRHALLTRNYHMLGRGDYTYRKTEAQTGFACEDVESPDSAYALQVPENYVRELAADPADRLGRNERPAEPSIRELQDATQRMCMLCQKKGFEVPGWAVRDMYECIKRETCGLVAPALKKGNNAFALALGRSMEADKEWFERTMGRRETAFGRPLEEEQVPEIPEELKDGWVDFEEIEAIPGAPWIDAHIVEDFARHLCYGDGPVPLNAQDWLPGVAYSSVTGTWCVAHREPESWTPTNLTRVDHAFGASGWNALRILEATLNLKQIKLDTEQETLAVLEKQDLILEEFKQWLSNSPRRRREVEIAYNQLFSAFAPSVPDGSSLVFPDMSSDIELFDYQKDAVAKILSEPNTLLALDTGAGKTYIMIAAAMRLRQMGKSEKNLFVVPNNIVGQWRSIFLSMYPDAKLLVIEPKTFPKKQREQMLRELKDGDYDGIIVAYSCLERIPLSAQWIRERHEAEARELAEETDRLSRQYPQLRFNRIRNAPDAMEKRKWSNALSLIESNEKLLINEELTFDKLGITGIFLDEAHNFKNVRIQTHLGSLSGLNTRGSVKCESMLAKVHCVQEAPGGWGAVLATATPLSNSLADAFVMQCYVQPDLLKAANLHLFDNWVKTFAKPESVCEIDVDTSRFRYVKRLARFFNLPDLSRMFSSTAAFHSVDAAEGLPELNGYTNELLEPGDGLRAFMASLVARTERIRKGEVARTEDNMLRVSVHGRMGALDLRLVGGQQPYDVHSKIYACVQNVMREYGRSEDSTQIVFCDYSTPKSNGFNVYDELKEHLMAQGVPERQIAFIHSYPTEAQKAHLYSQVNDGEVRVLIGSTFKLGIGTNVQKKLKAIHHLDVPWRPADMVQREGRILRRGNLNDTVDIYRYVCEGSFDAYSWQLLEQKQKFISQFLRGSLDMRTATDLEDTVLSYAQVKALAINEPLMRVLAEKENELRRARLLAENFRTTNAGLEKQSEGLSERVRQRKTFADATRDNAEFLSQIPKEEVISAGRALRESLTPAVLLHEEPLPDTIHEVLGFELTLPARGEQSVKKPFIFLSRQDATYRLEMGQSAAGNARRVTNFFHKFEEQLQRAEGELMRASAKAQANEEAKSGINPYQEQIRTLEQEVASLRQSITERAM